MFHPTAQMLVQLSKSQDIEAGDGTTGICVIAGSMLQVADFFLLRIFCFYSIVTVVLAINYRLALSC